MRGGERVLEVFCDLFPGADLFTLVHIPGAVSSVIEDRRIITSPLSRLPGIARSYRYFLPLFPAMVERFDLRDYDLVVSSSHCVAKAVRPGPGARHVSYVHTPMRYLWDRYEDYFGGGWAGPATRAAMATLRGPLRRWDRRTCDRVDAFVANSRFVAEAIDRIYGRTAEVVHAPVDTDLFSESGEPRGEEWLVVSAFAPYKRVDVAIRAARRAGVRLAIVGVGPMESDLRRLAGSGVRFLGSVPADELVRLYSTARGLLFPGVEDFGIVPLEAMACGCPVVALDRGGALETVVGAEWAGDPAGVSTGATGLFVGEQTPEAFAHGITVVESAEVAFDPDACRKRAEEFSTGVFRSRMAQILGIVSA
jgi:glycosyltransferase involved in cell wall biosynthesis